MYRQSLVTTVRTPSSAERVRARSLACACPFFKAYILQFQKQMVRPEDVQQRLDLLFGQIEIVSAAEAQRVRGSRR